MSWHSLYVSRMGNRYPRTISAKDLTMAVLSYFFAIAKVINSLINSITLPNYRSGLSNSVGGSGNVAKIAIQVGISEVVLFVMYQVFAGVITSINLTGVFKGTNGTLVTLVTLFYLLGAALVPLALVKHAGFL